MNGTVVRGGYGYSRRLNQGSTYYAMRVENGVVQINYNYSGCIPSVGASQDSKCPTVPHHCQAAVPECAVPAYWAVDLGFAPSSGGAAPQVLGPSQLGPQSFHGLDPNSCRLTRTKLRFPLSRLCPANSRSRRVRRHAWHEVAGIR